MLHSLFAVNESGDVFFEKHWRSIIPKSICDYFIDKKSTHPTNIPPIIRAHQYYLINVHRSNFYLVAVCIHDALPAAMIKLLHQIIYFMEHYFPKINESVIKDNMVIIYEILDEIIDGGLPLTTEVNVLEDLIKPPNILRTIANSVTGNSNICEMLPSSQLSNVPWRRSGVNYTNNEAFFDVVELLDVIIDQNGAIVFSAINGAISCFVQLSGIPKLQLTFVNPRIFDDIYFHRCVKVLKWENEKVVSFIPPEGSFTLLNYKVMSNNVIPIPLYIKHNLSMRSHDFGRLDVSVGPKQTLGRTIEEVKLEIRLPKNVLNCDLETNQGRFAFDSVQKLLTWDVGKIENKKIANIRGTVCFAVTTAEDNVHQFHDGTSNCVTNSNPSIKVSFLINQFAISGVKVNRLDMFGEKYKPFKGVKYITKASNFCMRI